MFDPNEYEEILESDQNRINEAGSFSTARQLVDRIETNRSEDLKILDEEIAQLRSNCKDREETLMKLQRHLVSKMKYRRRFLLE